MHVKYLAETIETAHHSFISSPWFLEPLVFFGVQLLILFSLLYHT